VLVTGAIAQVAIGPEGGILVANWPGKSRGEKYDAKAVLGLRLGAMADIHSAQFLPAARFVIREEWLQG